jgi:hypothetical protein
VWTGIWGGLAASPLVFSRGNGKLTDAIVMAEVMAFDLGVVRGAALLRAEPRPYATSDLALWDPEDAWLVTDDLRGDEAWTSSPALSTSTVAASSFGLATLALLHAEEKRPVPIALVYALAVGATALQGTADVLSRRADPGDVAIGATAGVAIGVLVPLWHKSISVVVDPERLARRRDR